MSGTIVVDLPDLGRAPVRLALRVAGRPAALGRPVTVPAGTVTVEVGISGVGGARRVSGAATLEVNVATGSLVTLRAPGPIRGRVTSAPGRAPGGLIVRRLVVLVTLLMVALVAAPAGAGQFPDEIGLPDGYFPEGIAMGPGTTFFIGSLADGTVYRGDVRTGDGEVLTDPTGPFSTVGIEVDGKNRIWVAGGPSGTGRVYDGRSGELLASYAFTAPFESFVNDVVVTPKAAYFTDSGTVNDPNPSEFRFAGEPRLFVVPLGKGQRLPDASAVTELDVGVPDITFPNLNGIETLPAGGLVVGHTVGQTLFAVDPADGSAAAIDVGVPLIGNDGIIRRGTTLYVVENALAQISAVQVAPDGSSGFVDEVYPVVGAESPTTAAVFGNALYVADARFFTMTGPYKVFRVELN